jgi:phage shock protein PspC (stress-responsive transcriptional regulator)
VHVNNHLYRCRHDRRIAGVSSGLAEFFGLDVSLMRILWFLSIFFTGGFSILLYLALALIVPLEPMTDVEAAEVATLGPSGHRHEPRGEGRVTTFIGLALILLGGLALIGALLPSWVDGWRYLGPAFFVGIGALLVVGALRGETPEVISVPDTTGSPPSA